MILFGKILSYAILAMWIVLIGTGAFGLIILGIPWYLSMLIVFTLPASFTYLLWARGK